MSTTPEANNAAANEQMLVTRYTYQYHNDSIGTLNTLLLGLLILIAGLVFLIMVQIGSDPEPLYFKLNKNSQIIDPVPLDQEGISTAALLNWVNEFVMKAFSFNYSNVQDQTSKLAPYFSDMALKVYADLLATNEDFRNMNANKFVVAVVPKSAPEIIVGKAFQDRFAWQIQVPVTITFRNALLKATQTMVFNFLVWRVPETESELGIIVATFTYKVTGRTGIQGIKQTL